VARVVKLAQADVHNALELVHEASSLDSTDPFPKETVGLFARLIPCEFTSYGEWHVHNRAQTRPAIEDPVVEMPRSVVKARGALCGTYPLGIVRRSTERRALKISDFASLRQLHRTEYYDCVLRPFRIEHQMRLYLSSPKGIARVFTFSRRREDGDFAERERTLLDLLRPSLMAIRARFDLNGHSCLTKREQEILRCVAGGQTNREIAMTLTISPHTVRKHLENAYAKLGVHNRTSAIARLSSAPQ
jgi:DNA-binding CsgD family transcriptional regulator